MIDDVYPREEWKFIDLAFLKLIYSESVSKIDPESSIPTT